MKLRILPSTVQDLRREQDFYSWQSDNLGEYFLDSLFADIDSLELYVGIHAKVFGYYRLLAKRFPFAVCYKVDDGVCTVARAGLPTESGENHERTQTQPLTPHREPFENYYKGECSWRAVSRGGSPAD